MSTQGICLARLSSSASHPTRHHTKFTKTSTKTRKRKNQLDGTHVVPSPKASPGAKPSRTSAVVLRFLFCECAAERGRSLRVHPRSISAPYFLWVYCGRGGGRTNLNRLPVPEFHFNSRAHVGHDAAFDKGYQPILISIHVPTWGTTCGLRCLHIFRPISIHVPLWDTTKSSLPGRTGRDFYLRRPDQEKAAESKKLQSTCPQRGKRVVYIPLFRIIIPRKSRVSTHQDSQLKSYNRQQILEFQPSFRHVMFGEPLLKNTDLSWNSASTTPLL